MSYVLAKMKCGHTADASIAEVAILSTFCYDPECRRPREIISIVTLEWHAFCYDCNYKRYFGNNAQAAQDASVRHYRKNNAHRPGAKMGTRPDSIKAQQMVTKRLGVAR